LPAFPDTCKAINLLSLRTPCQALKSGRKEETRIVPPEAFLVQTCVYDPAAQSVRAVAWFPAQEGVGNAGCPRTRSRVRKVESTRVSHHGYAGNPAFPHAMVLTGSSVLSLVTGLSCHHRLRMLPQA
jgi:hypothetical protein